MKRFFLFCFLFSVFFLLQGSGVRAQLIFNLNALGVSGTEDGRTGAFDQWGLYARTLCVTLPSGSSVQTGDPLAMTSMVKVSSLINSLGGGVGDTEGLNQFYEMTFYIEATDGTVTNAFWLPGQEDTQFVSFDYGSFETMVFFDPTPDFNATYDPQGGSFLFEDTASDGIPVLRLSIEESSGVGLIKDTDGDGTPDTWVQGSYTMSGYVEPIAEDFFLFSDGTPVEGDVYFSAGGDLNDVEFYNFQNEGISTFVHAANSDGSVSFDVGNFPPQPKPIPEAASILLTGVSLFALGSLTGILRRKSQ